MRMSGRIVCALLMAAAPAAAQQGDAIPLYTGVLGTFSWPVSTRVVEAQAYFDQGVKLMYAFAPEEARRRRLTLARTRQCQWQVS